MSVASIEYQEQQVKLLCYHQQGQKWYWMMKVSNEHLPTKAKA